MLEYITPAFVYTLGKDLLARIIGRRLTPAQILELRQKWKPEFEKAIWNKTVQQHGLDVIIRDVTRLDDYPEPRREWKRRISPWFKVGLMATYERGFLASLMWGTLTKDEADEWRFTDYKAGERGDITVILAGRIPYENVQTVDWSGDNYYSEPQIYCHFTRKGQPYEHKGVYLEQRNPSGPKFYAEVGDYKAILKRSRRRGIMYFG